MVQRATANNREWRRNACIIAEFDGWPMPYSDVSLGFVRGSRPFYLQTFFRYFGYYARLENGSTYIGEIGGISLLIMIILLCDLWRPYFIGHGDENNNHVSGCTL